MILVMVMFKVLVMVMLVVMVMVMDIPECHKYRSAPLLSLIEVYPSIMNYAWS